MDKNNILIIEDHALTSFALKTTLSTQDYTGEIFEATNASDAYKIIKENKIDLILMDIGLPDINGIEATKQIKSEYKDIKIAILTSHCDKDEVIQCLEAGVCAYCTKDIKPDKLSFVIKDILDGSMYFDSSVAKYVLESNSAAKEDKISVNDCYNLTTQEKRVLILLASGNNNQQIARKLKISVNTTKVHVCSILQKMNVEDRTQAAIKAIRENLIN